MQQCSLMSSLEHTKETRSHPFPLTVEHAAYLVIAIISLLLHLWQLDGRALHHDETLHALYSWNIFTGKPYMHDPLLHGPFLYYFGALIYFLFGDNDFTARLGFALFGTALTIMPYMIRREIGRPAALMASLYLLLSPSFLYMGRFARHDIYSVAFEMLVFIGVVRYATTHQSRWLYLIAGAFGLMYTNQETSYLFLLIMGFPLVMLFLWRVYKPGIAILFVMAFLVATFIFILPGEAKKEGPGVARDKQTGLIVAEKPGPLFSFSPLETADNGYALRIRNRADNDGGQSLLMNIGLYLSDVWKFFRHPAVLTALAITLIGLNVLAWLIWFKSDREGQSAWQRARAKDDGVLAIYETLVQDWRLLGGVAIFLIIYVFFFTAMLTNLLGIITGTTGSLLYWLAQHEVQRGSQPYQYYAVILTIYEPLVLIWLAIGLVIIGIQWFKKNQRENLLLPLLLAWWSFAAFAIYTWAGEKMPWLIIHIALPMVLFGSQACQWVLFRMDRATWATKLYRPLTIMFVTIFAWAAGLCFVEITTFIEPTAPVKIGPIVLTAMILIILMIVLYLLLVFAAGMNWGWRWSFSVMMLSITLFGSLYSVRNSYRLSFINGDVPKEMLIYTQTSPDVHRVVRRLEEISFRRTKGLGMPIYYDNETVWQWYLRNFSQATGTGPQLSKPPDKHVMAVLMLQENIDRDPQIRKYLQDFRIQRFPLRWWFPEDHTYRLRDDWRTASVERMSLLGRILRAPLSNETLVDLWKFLIYRETNATLGSTDFVIAVRPEIADQIGWGIGAELKYNPR